MSLDLVFQRRPIMWTVVTTKSYLIANRLFTDITLKIIISNNVNYHQYFSRLFVRILIMKGVSDFGGIKVIDYRNARYEGLFDSSTNKRQGLGVLIDDDMNFYFSQWKDGSMDGLTFIYFNTGSYMFGHWKNNQPYGMNIFRNKQFIMIGNYSHGLNFGNILAIPDSIHHLMVFNGEQISNRDKKYQPLIKQIDNILDINLYQEIIAHSAHRNQIKLEKNRITIIRFLSIIAEKHAKYLEFTNRDGYYYFGFSSGLGLRFTLKGRVNHRIKVFSIGSHQNDRLTDFGAKFHQSRCTQQGNFVLKQTITYNKNSQRPIQKCHSIYQKIHKKGLNYINDYYEYKKLMVANIEWFLTEKLKKKYQEYISLQFQMKKLNNEPAVDLNAKQDLTKKTGLVKKQREKAEKMKQITLLQQERRKSFTYLHKQQQQSPQPLQRGKRYQVQCHNPYHKKFTQHDNQQYKDIEDIHYPSFKKPITCQRCKLKEQRRKALTPQKEKNNSHNKSSSQFERSPKQIKYLINYKVPELLEQRTLKKSQSKNLSKASPNQWKIVQLKQVSKEQKQKEIQLNIREQLYFDQIEKGVINSHYPRYPVSFPEFLNLEENTRELNLQISPNLHPKYEYLYERQQPNKFENKPFEIIPQKQRYTGKITEDIFEDKFRNIEERREKILAQFKNLNTRTIPQLDNTKYIHNHSRYKSPIDNLQIGQTSRREPQDRRKIEEFNKKYRNYLNQDEKKDKLSEDKVKYSLKQQQKYPHKYEYFFNRS